MIETKERILDTAERLFAENGYSATSLRSIIAAAGVNLASVHYHFHSKAELLDAVIRRRVEPINRERLQLLEECERAAGDEPPVLECLLAALLAPPLRMAREPASAIFIKLMGRVLSESDGELIRRHFGDVFERFMGALGRALPYLPAEELLLRSHFAMGVMAHTLCGRAAIFGPPVEVTTERMVAFIAGGLRAPVAMTSGSNS